MPDSIASIETCPLQQERSPEVFSSTMIDTERLFPLVPVNPLGLFIIIVQLQSHRIFSASSGGKTKRNVSCPRWFSTLVRVMLMK